MIFFDKKDLPADAIELPPLLATGWTHKPVAQVIADFEAGDNSLGINMPIVLPGYEIPRSLLINGSPDLTSLTVQAGKTYVLRVINGGFGQGMDFEVAGHRSVCSRFFAVVDAFTPV